MRSNGFRTRTQHNTLFVKLTYLMSFAAYAGKPFVLIGHILDSFNMAINIFCEFLELDLKLHYYILWKLMEFCVS